MPNIARVFIELNNWLENNLVGKSSLHVILNFADHDEAARFHAALNRELSELTVWPGKGRDQPLPTDLEIMGIKVKIETPLEPKPQPE